MSKRLCLSAAIIAFAALMLPLAHASEDTTVDDEKLVKSAAIGVEAPALLDFFRRRTLADDDRRRFNALIAQLGDNQFEKREEASHELIKYGTPVLPLLRKAAASHEDAEVRRRAQACLEDIDQGPKAALPIACAHLLAARLLADAVPVLLAYLPHADDEEVEQAVLDALVTLNRAKLEAALVTALKDDMAVKRAAAAYVLGRSGDMEVRAAVLTLLADKNTRVRFRAVQGLLAAHEKAAVQPLIDLLVDAPNEELGDVEELLSRLGGESAPDAPASEEPNGRKKRREAWLAWWNKNGETVDLAKVNEADVHLGLNVVPEMHANKVWECGKDGKPRWTIENLQCPIDAQVLPGGRVLVAELNGSRVTERDRGGKVLWEHKVNTPIYCQRLPNGNTFISTNHHYFIVTREGKEIMSYTPPEGNRFFMHSVQRLRNGHVVVVTTAGQIRELDAAGKEVRTITLDQHGGCNGITGTPKGTYLVANSVGVQEIDTAGKKVWEHKLAGACYASRLPNGNTLIVNNSTGLLEVNREGTTVWSQKMTSSLWRGHRR
jgi:HEAT repeat protein